ncbi:hypothetical protein QN219_21210 [Sinorhizobium sp. 7-81]|uniref:hypothetical protein n=1 Tax=Sinorhizobium sp. 8-89 TaxID=3049089 RepID=UPI0024C46A09|nr:hypothetical protein [Sinorhizobium sp. 8-89]MDK1492549.1 hypothetical protein [Sinorhizobium sp. 8-89]
MGISDRNDARIETKALITAAIDEVERQAGENPSRLRVQRTGDKLAINGEIDMAALVMVVVGSMVGTP